MDIQNSDENLSTDDDEDCKTDEVNCLAVASKRKYARVFRYFKNWQQIKGVNYISEPLLLEYFQEMSQKHKPNSLWAYYSMLKQTFLVNLKVDISSYRQVLHFLKVKSSDYEPVRSKRFKEEELAKFIAEAPDVDYLLLKVICIFCICGSFRVNDLLKLRTVDIEEHGDLYLVRIGETKAKASGSLTITGQFHTITKKYVKLRPAHATSDRFFLNYRYAKCTTQPIGKNKSRGMAQKIAQYLQLPEPESFNGQAFQLTAQEIAKNTSIAADVRLMKIMTPAPSASTATAQQIQKPQNKQETESRTDEYYMKVDSLRIHCTVCDQHIGCAIANEENMKTHPILLVTQCRSCHIFYNVREFPTADDGCEVHCRWCGISSDDVYSCSQCPYVFCKKCIQRNVTTNFAIDIDAKDWKCFACAPAALMRQRVQHYTLVDYVRQTKYRLRSTKDPDQLNELMNKDRSTCCNGKATVMTQPNPVEKRRLELNSSSDCSAPAPKRISNHSVVRTPNQPAREQVTSVANNSYPATPTMPTIISQQPPPSPQIQRQSALSEPPPPVLIQLPLTGLPPTMPLPVHSVNSIGQLSSSEPPPPVVIQLPLTDRPPSMPLPAPNVNSIGQLPVVNPPGHDTYSVLVELGTQEDTFVRLPNGKLIQLKPQASAASGSTNRNAAPVKLAPVSIQNHAAPSVASGDKGQPLMQLMQHSAQRQCVEPQPLQQQHVQRQVLCPQSLHGQPIRQQTSPLQQPVHQQTVHRQSLIQQPLQHVQQQPVQRQLPHQQPAQQQSVQQKPLHHQPHVQQQQSSSGISNAPTNAPQPQTPPTLKQYPNTPLGQAQTELEKEVHRAHEICQQVTGKCNTLTKSNAYNSVQSHNDVRELHQHLSYLCSYAINRFTTLQNECTETMKSLITTHGATNRLTDVQDIFTEVDDDVLVIEPTTECIAIDSDDEPLAKVAKKAVRKAKSKKPPPKTNHRTKLIFVRKFAHESPVKVLGSVNEEVLELPLPPLLEDESYDRENDEKLKSLPKVVLEKNEEIDRKLEEYLERERSQNDAGAVSSLNDSMETNAVHTSEDDDKPSDKVEENKVKVEVEDSSTVQNQKEVGCSSSQSLSLTMDNLLDGMEIKIDPLEEMLLPDIFNIRKVISSIDKAEEKTDPDAAPCS